MQEGRISDKEAENSVVFELEVGNNESENRVEYEYADVWKLYDFTNEFNRYFYQKYGEELNITANTINNYFRDLEKEGIHFLNRVNGVKIYDTLDMSILEFIATKRSKKLQPKGITWQLPQIYEAIREEFPCRKKSTDSNKKNEIATKEDIEQFKSEILDLVKSFRDSEKKIIQIEKNNELALKELEEKSKRNVEDSMVKMLNIQREIKRRAWEEWEKKPENERFEGVWLFKREKIKDREKFIEDYVERETLKWILENRKETTNTNK